ncbi:hypothetical protein HZA76_04510 [Candidatus Roizmanbacteria bacterium]|nr:hypothetical protein [Candidatus Roizmanbacteria bacterium]
MLVAILFLLLVIVGIIFFVPPIHWVIVLSLISLTALTVFLLLRLSVHSKKYSLLGSLLIFVVLSLLALNLFDPVNVVLTISLFVAILILIK